MTSLIDASDKVEKYLHRMYQFDSKYIIESIYFFIDKSF